MLERRRAIALLLKDRPADLFIVSGLGSTTYDVASVEDDARNFYLWGAMGGAAMVGLGIALARPDLRVAVITGDGETLMGLGALASVGVQRPVNLAVIVFDNGLYGETGRQASHTGSGVDLVGAAVACGIELALNVADEAGVARLARLLKSFTQPLFARVAIAPTDPPRVLPSRDGVELKLRFRAAAGVK